MMMMMIKIINNNNNNLYLERVNTYVKPYGLVSESTLIFPRALTWNDNPEIIEDPSIILLIPFIMSLLNNDTLISDI